MIRTTISGSERNSQISPGQAAQHQEDDNLASASIPPITTLNAVPISVSTASALTLQDHRVKEPAGEYRPLPARIKGHGLYTIASTNSAATAPTARSG
jgi:hypothetical protein